jgi:hypothetical protein
MPAGRPHKFQDPKELEAKIEEYFAKAGEKPTITGLALHLDCEIETIKDYSEKDEFSAPIKRAYLRVQNGYENRMYETGPTGAIFALKNFGWKDKTEVEQKTDLTIDFDKLTDAELAKIAKI